MTAKLESVKSASLRDRVSKEEWQARVEVGLISEPAAKLAMQQFERPNRASTHKDWPALLRLLERKGINYQ